MADLWTHRGRITQQAGGRAAARIRRADARRPEIPLDTESDSSAEDTDQVGAEHSRPATSSPAASSPQASVTPEDQSPTQADARHAEGLGPRACSDNQRRDCRAGSDSFATSSDEAMQGAEKGHKHSTAAASAAAAASKPVPALAAVHAVPALAPADDAAMAVAQRCLPATQQAGSRGQQLLPTDDVHQPCQQTVSMSVAAGRPEANRGGTAAQAHTDANAEALHASEAHVKPDSSVSMSASICNPHEIPFRENRYGSMIGKRKRARKSTQSEHQPTRSVQQSNAILLQTANSVLKANNTASFCVSDNEAARDSSSDKPCAVDDVIDLTSDG